MAKRQTKEARLNLPDIPLDALLSFLKDTRGVVNWSGKDLRECLELDAKQAQQVLAILEMQGYIAPEGEQWLTTAAGESVSRSREPRLSRERVASSLESLKERIAVSNRNRSGEFKVTKAVAFGDFLSGRAQVQAADVGVELSVRHRSSGDSGQTEEKREEFLDALGRRSRFFSVQDYRPWMSRRSHRELI
jgi:hypothetical protein